MIKRCPSLKKHRPHSWYALVVVGGYMEPVDSTEVLHIGEIERRKVQYDCPGLDNSLERYIEMYGQEEV